MTSIAEQPSGSAVTSWSSGRLGRAWKVQPLVVRWGRGELRGTALGGDPAVVDDDHPVGQRLGLLHQVGGEQHGDAVAAQRADQFPDQPPGLRVHPGRRFVEEHQFGAADQRARQGQPLLLAAGQALVRGSSGRAEAEHVQQPGRVERVSRAGGDQPQHLVGPDAGVGTAALRHHADARAQCGTLGHGVEAEHADGARVRGAEPLADLHGGRLAGPVRAEQRQHRALGQVQVQVVDRGGVAVALDQPGDVDCRNRRNSPSGRLGVLHHKSQD